MVIVPHQGGSYPALVEPGLLGRLPALVAEHLPGRRLALISDDNVAGLYGHDLSTVADLLVFAAGEASKTRDTWAALTDRMLDAGHGRDSAVVALGGGVVGDLAGFVAATFGRGIPWLQLPTSLLAMVDASVGGKTGVDTAAGKNLVGAFHPPVAVLADPLALATLPPAELRSGLAEAVKHGLVADSAYFEWLLVQADAILALEPSCMTELVRRSVELKAAIVGADERDHGRRAVLNAGHTVAHAIERASSYRVSHGAAVALGLVAEAALAERLGVAEAGLTERVRDALARFGLATRLDPPIGGRSLLHAMRGDKKSRDGALRFSLIAAVGRARGEPGCWTDPASDEEIVASLGAIGAE